MEDYSNERLDAAEEMLEEGDKDAEFIWERAAKSVKLWLLKFKPVVQD